MYWWPATRKMDRTWEMFVAQVITSKSICSKTCACGREHDFCEVLGTNPRQCIPLMVLLSPRLMRQWLDFAAVKCRPDISSYFWWQVTWEHVALDMCGGQRRTAKLWRQAAALLNVQAYFFSTFCTCKLLCGSCPLETCFNSLPLLWSFITSGGISEAINWSLSCSCLRFPQVLSQCPDGMVTLQVRAQRETHIPTRAQESD